MKQIKKYLHKIVYKQLIQRQLTLAWVTKLNGIKLNSGDWPKKDFNLLLKRKNFGLRIIFMRNLYSKYYLVRKPQTNNHHAIHKEGCPFLPEKINRIYLGTYFCTANAITRGEKYYKNVRSCLFCLKESLEETNRLRLSPE
jgi:hypothetical protein